MDRLIERKENNCPHEKFIQAYVDDELLGGEEKEFLEHIKECPLCKDEVLEMRRVETLVNSLEIFTPSGNFNLRVMNAILPWWRKVLNLPGRILSVTPYRMKLAIEGCLMLFSFWLLFLESKFKNPFEFLSSVNGNLIAEVDWIFSLIKLPERVFELLNHSLFSIVKEALFVWSPKFDFYLKIFNITWSETILSPIYFTTFIFVLLFLIFLKNVEKINFAFHRERSEDNGYLRIWR